MVQRYFNIFKFLYINRSQTKDFFFCSAFLGIAGNGITLPLFQAFLVWLIFPTHCINRYYKIINKHKLRNTKAYAQYTLLLCWVSRHRHIFATKLTRLSDRLNFTRSSKLSLTIADINSTLCSLLRYCLVDQSGRGSALPLFLSLPQ